MGDGRVEIPDVQGDLTEVDIGFRVLRIELDEAPETGGRFVRLLEFPVSLGHGEDRRPVLGVDC